MTINATVGDLIIIQGREGCEPILWGPLQTAPNGDLCVRYGQGVEEIGAVYDKRGRAYHYSDGKRNGRHSRADILSVIPIAIVAAVRGEGQ